MKMMNMTESNLPFPSVINAAGSVNDLPLTTKIIPLNNLQVLEFGLLMNKNHMPHSIERY